MPAHHHPALARRSLTRACAKLCVAMVASAIGAGVHAEPFPPAACTPGAKGRTAAAPNDKQRSRFRDALSSADSGRHSEAIERLEKLAKEAPGFAEAHNNLAVLYAQKGQHQKAAEQFQLALCAHPVSGAAFVNLQAVNATLAREAYARALQVDLSSNKAPAMQLGWMREDPQGQTTVMPAPAAPRPAPKPVAPAPSPVAAAPAPRAAESPPSSPPPASVAPKPPVAAEQQAVEEAVRRWARAWSAKDLNAYFAAYVANYPDNKAHREWQTERIARIQGKRSIDVNVSRLSVTVNGDKASVRFHQSYTADSLKRAGPKTLGLVRQGGRWLIVKETAGA